MLPRLTSRAEPRAAGHSGERRVQAEGVVSRVATVTEQEVRCIMATAADLADNVVVIVDDCRGLAVVCEPQALLRHCLLH